VAGVLLLTACSADPQFTVGDVDALAAAQADPEDRYDASFVGRVEGTDALIGLTPYEGQLLAYVCDGDPAELGGDADISAWLDGPITDGLFALSNDGGVRLEGRQTATGFEGTVTLEDGSVHGFAATAAEGDEGLYREWLTSGRERGIIDIGWIKFDGVTTGAIKPIVITGAAPTAPECPLRPPALCR
jgi:hypothetical protein